MSFPDTPRVIYNKNPLAEVICQLRFPSILLIDAGLPAGFQERIRAMYPLFADRGEQGPIVPSEFGKLLGEKLGMVRAVQRAAF